MITDEMKRKALDAYMRSDGISFDENLFTALEAVTADIRNAALEEARGVAKVAWLTCPHLDTVDADAVCAVSEHAANGIEALKHKVTP